MLGPDTARLCPLFRISLKRKPQTEKTNDLIVARRQKRQDMHWSLETSDALAALKTLMLNSGWELYSQHRQVSPLAA